MNLHPRLVSGQPHADTDTVWSIPYAFGPDGLVEPGVNAHIWSSHLLRAKFPDLCECPRGTLLETHSMDTFVNVDGVFSGHYLIDGRMALLLLATLLCQALVGKEVREVLWERESSILPAYFNLPGPRKDQQNKPTSCAHLSL